MSNEDRLKELLSHRYDITAIASHEYYKIRLNDLLKKVAPEYMNIVHNHLLNVYEKTMIEIEKIQEIDQREKMFIIMNKLLTIINKFDPNI